MFDERFSNTDDVLLFIEEGKPLVIMVYGLVRWFFDIANISVNFKVNILVV